MQTQISLGTLDSPSWDIIRSAKLAARIYAPLGTSMSLGDYVRVCRAFVEVFKWADDSVNEHMFVTVSGSEEENEGERKKKAEWINSLTRDLKVSNRCLFFQENILLSISSMSGLSERACSTGYQG